MKKMIIALFTACLLGGCNQQPTVLKPEEKIEIEFTDPTEEVILNYTTFSLELFKQVYKDENALISPLSLSYALSMAASGAKDETLKQMEKVLHCSVQELLPLLYPELDSFGLKVANSIWIKDDPSLQVKKDFINRCSQLYSAEIYKAPFNEQTANDMNDWVNKQTNGMIPSLLKSINKNDNLVLLNALTFIGEWVTPYEKNASRNQIFYSKNGTHNEVTFMNGNEDYYLETESMIGMTKKYKDSNYEFVALMPKGNIYDFINQLSSVKLNQCLSAIQNRKANISIPKFNFDDTNDWNLILKKLGMTDAFDPQKANFSSTASIDNGNIFVNQVIQTTQLNFYENGTKAASATVIDEGATEASLPPVELTFDHPFMFMILEKETQIPVFMGTVMNL